MEEIKANGIKMYDFPTSGEDEEEMELNRQMKVSSRTKGDFALMASRPA